MNLAVVNRSAGRTPTQEVDNRAGSSRKPPARLTPPPARESRNLPQPAQLPFLRSRTKLNLLWIERHVPGRIECGPEIGSIGIGVHVEKRGNHCRVRGSAPINRGEKVGGGLVLHSRDCDLLQGPQRLILRGGKRFGSRHECGRSFKCPHLPYTATTAVG